MKLRWEQVDFLEGRVRLRALETKNKAPRTFMTRETAGGPQATAHGADQYHPETEWVFFRYATGEGIRDIRGAWEGASKKAGLLDYKAGIVDPKTGEPAGKPKRLLHAMRRTGIRNQVRGGTSEAVAMKISGTKPAASSTDTTLFPRKI